MTVSELNAQVKSILTSLPFFSSINVVGEISGWKGRNAYSGHAYFELKDSKASLKCTMFKWDNMKLDFVPQDGIQVVVTGDVTLYETTGAYQLNVKKMVPIGFGNEYLKFCKMKDDLDKKGLFSAECKKSLPIFPKSIGLITSKTGAAIKDFLRISQRRFPQADIILYPAIMQGPDCAESVIKGLKYFENRKVDVICITRGGGSYEDLAWFNNENIAYAIFNSDTPVVSAIGHEIDTTIPDFVADVRASTPSNAAEIICPDISSLLKETYSLISRIKFSVNSRIKTDFNRLETINAKLSVNHFVGEKEVVLDSVCTRIKSFIKTEIYTREKEISGIIGKIEALNPLSVLSRGFAAVTLNGSVVVSADELSEGDRLKLKFSDGVINCVAGKKDNI